MKFSLILGHQQCFIKIKSLIQEYYEQICDTKLNNFDEITISYKAIIYGN